jgi:putative RNA 2'-phosphotransferase
MSRQHVHLSEIEEIALKVGQWHGKPIILIIDSDKMFKDGIEFYLSENNVWLTERVPVGYIRFSDLGEIY